jgi:hypothetical protein
MADAAAHDSIGDLWNQKTIHFLVIFTSPDQDFEIIGVGPTLPYTMLEAAEAHQIPNKKPEFYVKCPAAIAGRLQPKLAPTPPRSTRPPNIPASMPSMKGRTAVPFLRPALNMPSTPASVEQETGAEIVPPKPPTEPTPAPTPPVASAAQFAQPPTLEERERAIAKREQELAALGASLKIREAALREREAALAASEEKLLNPPPKAN